jgi:hypothetical protein
MSRSTFLAGGEKGREGSASVKKFPKNKYIYQKNHHFFSGGANRQLSRNLK